MEIAIGFITKWVIGPVVGIVIGFLAKEPVRKWLAPKAIKFGMRVGSGINGIWEATFFYGENGTPYIEVIEIKTVFGQVVGNIIPHDRNHENAKKVAEEKPLRIIGTLKDSRYLTGEWYHPNRKNHHHGAYKLLVSLSQEIMEGMWIGYSETRDEIETGRWSWREIKL